jgi:beta-glucanase (GH16 family)
MRGNQHRVRCFALAAALAAVASHTSAADLFRDDFNGSSINFNQWSIGTWQLGRTFLGNTPAVTNGIASLKLDTYNAQHLGSFKGTELWTNSQYARGTNGLELEARVRVNSLPSGLVTSFFTYAARTQFSPPLADEIDFEHLSKALNAAPAGQKPILLTTWNDYKTDGSNFGDPNVHSSVSVVANGWDPTQFHTYRIRWLGNRVEWYLDDQLLRTATQAVSTDPQNVRINFWAPDSSWGDAYASSLTPTTNSAQNQSYFYDLDWVAMRDAYSPVSASAPNRVFTDHFKNGNVGNSDSVTNFWTQRNLGTGTVTETTGDPLRLSVSGSGFPHAQVASAVRSEFNFFNSPIRITGDGIAFNSTTNSYAKSILRFALSSQTLASGNESEFTAEDALSLRIQGDNQITLGYKLNQTNTNSEFNTPLLNTSVSGPVRHFVLTLSPDFYKLTVEHELSSTDGTRITDTFTGSLSLSMSDWALIGQQATGNNAMFIQGQFNNSTAGESMQATVDSLSVDAVKSTWQNDAFGDWSSASSWDAADGVPNFRGANAIFGNVITLPRTVRVDFPQTAGVLQFDSAVRYTLSGATITLDTPAAGAAITVLSGSHTIASAIQLAKDTTIIVLPQVATLTLSGGVRGAAGLTKTGTGSLEVSQLDVQALNVSAGKLFLLNSGTPVRSAVTSLSISSGATLDLGKNALVINYSGGSPDATVRSMITGNLLTSSFLGSTSFGVGYAEASALGGAVAPLFGSVDATTLLVRWTRLGDASLDGTVDLTDFTFLAANFNSLNREWVQGDFNYAGQVDLTDFSLLATNFNLTANDSPIGSPIPEPALLALTALPLALLRRRRHSY